MIKEFAINENIKLALQETTGSKGTIIAVHGLTGNHKNFYRYKKLLGEDYNFIRYDVRGRGDSSPADENTTIFTHAKDLKTFINKNKMENPILMGYSMGACICALVASEIEVSGLILLDGAGTIEEKHRELIATSLNRLRKTYHSADDYVTHTRKIYESLNVEWNEAMEEITRYEVKETSNGWKHKSDAQAMEQDFNSFFDFHPGAVFEKINCPTLLVIAYGPLGQNESLFTNATYVQTIAKAKDLMTIKVPANHYTLMFNKQEQVEESIIELLKKVNRRSEMDD